MLLNWIYNTVKKIILLGNSVAAEIVAFLLSKINTVEVVAFTVSNSCLKEPEFLSKPIYPLENLSKICSPDEYQLVNAIGYSNVNKHREHLFQYAKAMGYTFLTYVHPQAAVLTENAIGEGVLIMPNVVIEPYATIGANTVIWSNAVIAHHAMVHENCWVAAGTVISGHASIGKNTFVGVNATIVDNSVVAEYNIIGANVLLSKNTNPHDVILARSGEKHRFASDDYAVHYL